jgi:predicted Zn finger-like uncharacterized protein
MIIQCDQCNTKFRLDDSKVPDKGVKVRCAKCKNIFMVRKETPTEEPDLDVLLSGLGAQSAADTEVPKGEETPPPEESVEGGITTKPAEISETPPVETPAVVDEQHGGREDFGEEYFSFKPETAASEEDTSLRGEYDFGDETSPIEEETGLPEESKGMPGEFDFGEYPFEEEVKPAQPEESERPPVAETAADEFDFGTADFGPEESLQPSQGETFEAAPAGFEAEGGVVEEEKALSEKVRELMETPEPTVESPDEFDFSMAPPQEEKTEDIPETAGEKETVEWLPAEAEETGGEEFSIKEEAAITEEPPSETAKEKETVVPVAPLKPSAEEELPPLAISTRKKTSSLFPVTVTTVALLVVIAVAGFGFYVYKEGPAAFDKLGLPFLAKWIGMKSSALGSITVRNQQGAFMVNREAGEIFVVTGETLNSYKEPRASIQVKATILGPNGEALIQKTAYCGNTFSKEQLTTLPMDKIEEAMGNPFGDALANLSVPPGKSIPFTVVFSKVPKNAGEFTVEVIGSTSASQ